MVELWNRGNEHTSISHEISSRTESQLRTPHEAVDRASLPFAASGCGMRNAKGQRSQSSSKHEQRCAALCSAVRSAALQLVVSTPTSSPVEVPAPHHHHKANCRKLPAAMIQLNCLHCAGVRESERERKGDVLHERL